MRREEFLALLSRKVNEYNIQGDSVCFDGFQYPLRLPEEYVALLHYCDAVRDPDLRMIDVGGLYKSKWSKRPLFRLYRNNKKS